LMYVASPSTEKYYARSRHNVMPNSEDNSLEWKEGRRYDY